MREARKEERYLTNSENSIISRVQGDQTQLPIPEQTEQKNDALPSKDNEFESYPDLLIANKMLRAKGRR